MSEPRIHHEYHVHVYESPPGTFQWWLTRTDNKPLRPSVQGTEPTQLAASRAGNAARAKLEGKP